ncbi:MAG: RluA family pseudouridine synthase [Alphaproteobacteria bacterium]|jgi:23S rRNA pseudouridine1911/1915/1917 synthase|nr:RluA family pseudouridine synthase [Alphaproteobacteria bacterium]
MTESSSDGERRTLTIDESQAGQRLDRVLAGVWSDLSRSRLQQLIAAGAVTGAKRPFDDASQKVKLGEALTLVIPPAVSAVPEGEDIALNIVFEDAHLIVIDKPAGLVVHPAAGNRDGTLVNALIAHCGESLRGIGGELRPGIVHRIDKDTTGLMVAAKTEKAMTSLGKQFAAHAIERVYRAIVWGVPRERSGTIDAALGRSPLNRQKIAVLRVGGKPARTHYKVIEAFGTTASLIECRLETGRTHQIRVHMAHIGHPLVGDPVYGRPRTIPGLTLGISRQALHAAVLGFHHPGTDKPVRFESVLPEDFTETYLALKGLGQQGRGS